MFFKDLKVDDNKLLQKENKLQISKKNLLNIMKEIYNQLAVGYLGVAKIIEIIQQSYY